MKTYVEKMQDIRERIRARQTQEASALCPDIQIQGLGLHLMRYRANLIGATLRLTSDDGETVVECRLPLP